jgi:hypothetical protein
VTGAGGGAGGRSRGGDPSGRSGGNRAGVVHVDDDSLTILGAGLATGGVLVRMLRTQGHDLGPSLIGATLDEVFADGLGATIGETEIVFRGAEMVGVTGDDDIGGHDAARDGVDLGALIGGDGVLIEIEVDGGEDGLGRDIAGEDLGGEGIATGVGRTGVDGVRTTVIAGSKRIEAGGDARGATDAQGGEGEKEGETLHDERG